MRLIDVDLLKESIGPIALLIAYRDDKGKTKRIKDVIDNQPTSYDVDKVVEQLEIEVNGCGNGSFDQCIKTATLTAIDIVKGAVKDE